MARMSNEDYNGVVSYDKDARMTISKDFDEALHEQHAGESISLRDMVKRYNELNDLVQRLMPCVYFPTSFDAETYSQDVRNYNDVVIERVHLQQAIRNRVDRVGHFLRLWESPRETKRS